MFWKDGKEVHHSTADNTGIGSSHAVPDDWVGVYPSSHCPTACFHSEITDISIN